MKTARFKLFTLHSSLFILLLAACSRQKPEPPAPPPPPIHDLVLKNLASGFPDKIRTADYAGQIQLILFLRTDDSACRGALSGWNALQEEFGPRGFTLVGAVADERPLPEISAEAAALALAFPVGHAPAPIVAAFGGPGAIRAVPTAFLLSRDGALLNTYAGFTPFDDLRADLDAALNGLPLPSLPDPDEKESP